MLKLLRRVIIPTFGFVGTLILAASATSIDDARSNLGGYLAFLGWTGLPSTIFGQPIDRVGIAIGLCFLVAAMAWCVLIRLQPKGVWTPYQALTYMANASAWGAKIRAWKGTATHQGSLIEAKKVPLHEAFDEFQARAQRPDTKIVVWGLENGRGAPKRIEPSFWLTNRFHFLDTISGQGNRTQPTLHLHSLDPASITYFTDMRVERVGVMRTWRPMLSPLAIWREWRRRRDETAYFRSIGYL